MRLRKKRGARNRGQTEWDVVELVPGAVDDSQPLLLDEGQVLPADTAPPLWAEDHPWPRDPESQVLDEPLESAEISK